MHLKSSPNARQWKECGGSMTIVNRRVVVLLSDLIASVGRWFFLAAGPCCCRSRCSLCSCCCSCCCGRCCSFSLVSLWHVLWRESARGRNLIDDDVSPFRATRIAHMVTWVRTARGFLQKMSSIFGFGERAGIILSTVLYEYLQNGISLIPVGREGHGYGPYVSVSFQRAINITKQAFLEKASRLTVINGLVPEDATHTNLLACASLIVLPTAPATLHEAVLRMLPRRTTSRSLLCSCTGEAIYLSVVAVSVVVVALMLVSGNSGCCCCCCCVGRRCCGRFRRGCCCYGS